MIDIEHMENGQALLEVLGSLKKLDDDELLVRQDLMDYLISKCPKGYVVLINNVIAYNDDSKLEVGSLPSKMTCFVHDDKIILHLRTVSFKYFLSDPDCFNKTANKINDLIKHGI